MRMPNGILVGGKDKSDMYIFATTSHDGSFSLSVALTAVRVVCQNTWRMARRASQYKHTIRHTANSNKSIAQAKALCGACPMKARCLEGALSRAEPCGVWGGELFDEGQVIQSKRLPGRPAKIAVAS